MFNVEVIPEPDFTLDIDAIESKGVRTKTQASIPPSLQLMNIPESRVQHVGVRAIASSQRTGSDDNSLILKGNYHYFLETGNLFLMHSNL